MDEPIALKQTTEFRNFFEWIVGSCRIELQSHLQ